MADPAAPELMAAKSAVTSIAPRLTRAVLAAIPTPRLANLAVVTVIVACLIVAAGCGSQTAATPVHQVNVFFDGMNHYDFRQACSVVHIPNATPANCEGYFAYTTVVAGGVNIGRAVPHSEKITGDTATVRGEDNHGGKYVATLEKRHGRWVLTSMQAA